MLLLKQPSTPGSVRQHHNSGATHVTGSAPAALAEPLEPLDDMDEAEIIEVEENDEQQFVTATPAHSVVSSSHHSFTAMPQQKMIPQRQPAFPAPNVHVTMASPVASASMSSYHGKV